MICIDYPWDHKHGDPDYSKTHIRYCQICRKWFNVWHDSQTWRICTGCERRERIRNSKC